MKLYAVISMAEGGGIVGLMGPNFPMAAVCLDEKIAKAMVSKVVESAFTGNASAEIMENLECGLKLVTFESREETVILNPKGKESNA